MLSFPSPNIDVIVVFFLISIPLNFSVVKISYFVASVSKPFSKNSTSLSKSFRIILLSSTSKPYVSKSFTTFTS